MVPNPLIKNMKNMKIKELTDFYMWMQDHGYDHNIRERVERKAEMYLKEKTESEEISNSLTPHRCPVCGGTGLVPAGFYSQTSGQWTTTYITPEICRTCGGNGIVWG